jgi:hypothetical protein
MDYPRCAHCQEIIGTYEQIVVVLRGGSKRLGSSVTLSAELAEAGSMAAHAACHAAAITALSPRSPA